MIGAYPFRESDEIRVSVRASVTTVVTLFARVRYVDGTQDVIEIILTHSAGDRSNELKYSPDPFQQDGWIEHLTVDTDIIKRGEMYIMVAINREPHHFGVFAGWIGVPHVPLGFFEPMESFGWSYNRDRKYTAGAAINGTVDYIPATDTYFEVDSVMFIVGGVQAGGADVGQILKINTVDATLGELALDTTLGVNQNLQIPSPGDVANANNNTPSSERVVIHGSDKLRVSLDGMANAEIFTVRARFLIFGPEGPAITTSANLTEGAE